MKRVISTLVAIIVMFTNITIITKADTTTSIMAKTTAMLPQLINIEAPINNETITNSGVDISGWAINNSGFKAIKVYVNGNYLEDAIYGFYRYDVQAVYPKYSDSLTSGFKISINKNSLVAGKNIIQLNFIGNDGGVENRSIILNYQVIQHKYNLELPYSDNIDSDLNIQGWSADGTGIKNVEVFIDNVLKGNAKINIKRQDVYNVFNNYADSDKSGFELKIAKTDISYGNHKLRVEITQNSGNKATVVKDFYQYKYKPIFNIDSPIDIINVKKDLLIQGWILNYTGISEINVYNNGSSLGKATIGLPRKDVYNVYPQYNNENSGFTYNIPIGKLQNGINEVMFEAISNDGKSILFTKSFEFQDLGFRSNIDSPEAEVNNTDLVISGWALDSYGISKVNVYIDDEYQSSAEIGINRYDVNNAYPKYNTIDSGYKLTLDKTKFKVGSHKLKVETISNSGKVYYQERNFVLNKMASLMNLESPYLNYYFLSSSPILNVSGWAITNDGVKDIKVYVDNKFVSNAVYGGYRPDVASAYPKYNKEYSGFSYSLDLSKYPKGKHTIKVIVTSVDGAIIEQYKDISTYDTLSIGNIDTPSNYVYENNNVNVLGWALNYSGIKSIDVYLNNKYLGEATYGLERRDVADTFEDYPSSLNSGFSFNIASELLNFNNSNIKLIINGNDNTKVELNKQILVKYQPRINIETTYNNEVLSADVKISGWAIAHNGVSKINMYANKKFIGTAQYGTQRYDVAFAYPNYVASLNSGFNFTIPSSSLNAGMNEIVVEMISNDGEKITNTINIRYASKLIVIDPGHDYGGDYGAVAIHNGVKYEETVLNMEVAVKLKASLEAKGYKVEMTRQLWEKPISKSARESLEARANFANALKADLFISIHHDSSSAPSARGTSTHYSTYKPGIDNEGIITIPKGQSYEGAYIDTTPSSAAILSRDLASKIVNSVSRDLGRINRGADDHNLYVTVNTNMAAVLVEGGFISNPDEAAAMANSVNQQKFADAIANSVKEMF
ncbi:N-acetylmuramoyl-L-alanine amidase [Clostridium intestinale]|uniref:N-acetylmuramoyl-L-alanine amidase n=1 Tax=Clostridium intestinale TaxID=36845 RepID=A0A7D6VRC2_9CLOT|nr:N-acetylmuramoyl-L-alanine amidase [Clostridium intestinale]QLY79117.1 N-acetylmuramoyl-L-alanine amidase [Clostridium intestinale]